MASGNMRLRTFRRMMAREAGSGATAPAIAVAARSACEQFARQMAPLIGDAGVSAICARGLHLAQRNVPGLAPIPIDASEQSQDPVALLQRSLEQQEPAAATEAAAAVLVTITELLASFIGESLTTRLLREAWPDDFAGDATEEPIT
jgi:hypothetical protein